ncbi:hypothetical protein EV356DRAFT_533244 [Viridothelium virens]|uniref:Uncharacterized protein n=1 Tax=Viridothelium virens TaxID=1048519 RepID=A0A6A6H7G8_VIRVR|nr:hypothetical protein EV356DRAFT_533244 [Viridothelium virens]
MSEPSPFISATPKSADAKSINPSLDTAPLPSPPNPTAPPSSSPSPEPNPPTPPTSSSCPPSQTFILTLLLSPSLITPLTSLRQTHFPSTLPGATLPAHLTLFHTLPSSHLPAITTIIARISAVTRRFSLRIPREGVYKLGSGGPKGRPRVAKGVGIRCGRGGGLVREVRLALLRAFLEEAGGGTRVWGESGWKERYRVGAEQSGAKRDSGWLTAQDRLQRGWTPHFTVVNKEADEKKVEGVYRELRYGWEGCEGEVEGLQLWRYEVDGRWTWERDWRFEREEGRKGLESAVGEVGKTGGAARKRVAEGRR